MSREACAGKRRDTKRSSKTKCDGYRNVNTYESGRWITQAVGGPLKRLEDRCASEVAITIRFIIYIVYIYYITHIVAITDVYIYYNI